MMNYGKYYGFYNDNLEIEVEVLKLKVKQLEKKEAEMRKDLKIGKDFIERIGDWNAERFEREVDQDIFIRLILEELAEFSGAKQRVDRVDALADLIYLAMGGMWRESLSADQIERIMEAVCTANETKLKVEQDPAHKFSSFKGDDFVAPEEAIKEIIDDSSFDALFRKYDGIPT